MIAVWDKEKGIGNFAGSTFINKFPQFFDVLKVDK